MSGACLRGLKRNQENLDWLYRVNWGTTIYLKVRSGCVGENINWELFFFYIRIVSGGCSGRF